MNFKIAIPTGRLLNDSWNFLRKIDRSLPEISKISRKLIWEGEIFKIFLVKPFDIPTYVEERITDLGIVGGDVIKEKESNIVTLKKLNFGNCKMVIASHPQWKLEENKVKVSTKYPNIVEKYLKNIWKGFDIEIVKLNGSIELAPLAEISDCIVDLVETGNTLRENNLVIKEILFETSACLIANEVSFVWNLSLIHI